MDGEIGIEWIKHFDKHTATKATGVDWPRSGSRTFQTWSKPDFEPGVRESGLAEYLNPNLLASSGSSSGRTQTPTHYYRNQ